MGRGRAAHSFEHMFETLERGGARKAPVGYAVGVSLLPALDPATGLLPRGRYLCNLTEFHAMFVADAQFASSTTRAQIFEDLVAALEFLLTEFHEELVECIWVGGSFTTAKPDPNDIDVTFLLNHEHYSGLSGRKRDKLHKLLRAGGFEAVKLSVDGFMIVRERISNPWKAGAISTDAAPYLKERGGWDDWWSRHRSHGNKSQQPLVDDADPTRGYLEVTLDA